MAKTFGQKKTDPVAYSDEDVVCVEVMPLRNTVALCSGDIGQLFSEQFASTRSA
ncbi:hypothetical protein [Bradyrhizobium cenepequi]|uniref:hypothetical protein n=1 Tax=Bradyrhizobium cenepequi TaxID=2821403 RepID=UPI001CE33FE6|nr:hypothetical protein [Bradyrhizobium cenepequi]MCA6107981.1 hypothetical protein [Bradyrhizobium cenepequi]